MLESLQAAAEAMAPYWPQPPDPRSVRYLFAGLGAIRWLIIKELILLCC